jgi:Holliday junction resolvase
MAMTPEKKVKKKVTDYLKAASVFWFYPVASGYSANGIPDIICCIKGKFVAIECKAGDNKTTAIQEKKINDIRLAGGMAMVINEDNLDHMKEVIDELIRSN